MEHRDETFEMTFQMHEADDDNLGTLNDIQWLAQSKRRDVMCDPHNEGKTAAVTGGMREMLARRSGRIITRTAVFEPCHGSVQLHGCGRNLAQWPRS